MHYCPGPIPFNTDRTCIHIPTWWPWIGGTASPPDFHTACPSEWRRTGTYTQTKAINNSAVVECSRDMVHKYYGGRTNAVLVLPPYPPHEIVLLFLYTKVVQCESNNYYSVYWSYHVFLKIRPWVTPQRGGWVYDSQSKYSHLTHTVSLASFM